MNWRCCLRRHSFRRIIPEDRMIAAEYIKRTGVSYEEEQMTPEQRIDDRIDFMNILLREWGVFKQVYEIYKQHNVKMWLHIEGV
ncbi:MAG: hypothetical protein QW090_07940 [Candidatus Bathyarchaeia archaeon]